jgi:hypothetical protein
MLGYLLEGKTFLQSLKAGKRLKQPIGIEE